MHEDEILTDNTKIHYCKQCKACAFWDGGDAYSNAYDKTCCQMYPYPDMKPLAVMHNTGACPYRLAIPGRA